MVNVELPKRQLIHDITAKKRLRAYFNWENSYQKSGNEQGLPIMAQYTLGMQQQWS